LFYKEPFFKAFLSHGLSSLPDLGNTFRLMSTPARLTVKRTLVNVL